LINFEISKQGYFLRVFFELRAFEAALDSGTENSIPLPRAVVGTISAITGCLGLCGHASATFSLDIPLKSRKTPSSDFASVLS
jgi:hypothetical protein